MGSVRHVTIITQLGAINMMLRLGKQGSCVIDDVSRTKQGSMRPVTFVAQLDDVNIVGVECFTSRIYENKIVLI